ncbi:hypothetical protein BURMUCGD1_6230 [Burkholderia multivorans CGD1]|nr:hypothetical protein BURMUCGD1_6230 [Burkholderia multivorans CGD1]
MSPQRPRGGIRTSSHRRYARPARSLLNSDRPPIDAVHSMQLN